MKQYRAEKKQQLVAVEVVMVELLDTLELVQLLVLEQELCKYKVLVGVEVMINYSLRDF